MGETVRHSFLSWRDGFKSEAEYRLDTDIEKLCRYGIKPLDDSLICIRPGELVVIGADSGVGKTEIAIQIASHNAKLGKKVALYHLEGGYREAVSRMKWKDICRHYYANHSGLDMSYQKWVLNIEQDKLLTEIEALVWKEYEEKFGDNLFLHKSDSDLTIIDFLASLMDFHSLSTAAGAKFNDLARESGFDLDLIIIDHLQYFSLDQAENEITEITNIIRKVKHLTDKYGIPVVLISHLRKKTKDRGLPDQSDFYGSSNIPKISTTSITITPQINKEDFVNQIYPTWIRVVKSRVGIKPSIAMLCDFDNNQKNYLDKYSLYRVNGDGHTSPEPLAQSELPKWARKPIEKQIDYTERMVGS